MCSNISLLGSINGCKVDSGWANRIQSARFQDPSAMLCPTWNGFNNVGQRVCPDSFFTKRAGCNSAIDRIAVENNLRPQYAEYINLDAQGIQSNSMYADNMNWVNVGRNNASVAAANKNGPNFGLDFGADTIVPCHNQYSDAMAQMSGQKRASQYAAANYNGNNARQCAGM